LGFSAAAIVATGRTERARFGKGKGETFPQNLPRGETIRETPFKKSADGQKAIGGKGRVRKRHAPWKRKVQSRGIKNARRKTPS